jgi:hypothetical protein
MKIIYTKIAELRYKEEEALLFIKVLEGAAMNLENTKNHYEAIKNLTGNKKYLALVDASNYFTIEPAALEYASMPQVVENRIATAHFNSSFANSLTTNFFKAHYNPPIHITIFETKREALEWLKSIHATIFQTG